MSRTGVLVAAAVLAASVAQAAGGWHTLSGRVDGARGRSWQWGFDVRVDPDAVRLRVRMHPVAAAGLTRAELERALARWKPSIEAAWSGRWAVLADDGRTLPIALELDFGGQDPLHEVLVIRGRAGVDKVHWRLGDDPRVLAHEVGHMLGLYDEYPAGAVAPGGPRSDPASIMGQGGGQGQVRARHFARVLAWFQEHTGQAAGLVPLDGAFGGATADAAAFHEYPGRERGEP